MTHCCHNSDMFSMVNLLRRFQCKIFNTHVHRKSICYNACISVCQIHIGCFSPARNNTCSLEKCTQDLVVHIPPWTNEVAPDQVCEQPHFVLYGLHLGISTYMDMIVVTTEHQPDLESFHEVKFNPFDCC